MERQRQRLLPHQRSGPDCRGCRYRSVLDDHGDDLVNAILTLIENGTSSDDGDGYGGDDGRRNPYPGHASFRGGYLDLRP